MAEERWLRKGLFYRYFLDGVPDYLARNYWWAYLWKPGAWFFDHQPIINAILFGQYQRLMGETLRVIQARPSGRMLQLSCVYGKLTPSLAGLDSRRLHLTDVSPVQLGISMRKAGEKLVATRMNAESLGYRDGVFDTVLIFFLMHEMPPEARRRTLSEAIRVLSPKGRLVITEYGHEPNANPIYRFRLSRWIIGKLEPFLPGFWREELDVSMKNAASINRKTIKRNGKDVPVFKGFYRVAEYEVE